MIPPITGLGEIFHFTVESDRSLAHGVCEACWTGRSHFRLRQVPGSSRSTPGADWPSSSRSRSFPEKLVAHGIALADVFEAVEKNNAMAGSAYLERGREQLLIRRGV